MTDGASGNVRRFACTMCGKRCNRAPEIELSEAASLADIFVFRLMFRLYMLPRAYARGAEETAEAFYEKKRLMALHAARSAPTKIMRAGKRADAVQYVMISALALDTRGGACPALSSKLCSIHERRPATCRTVPFHYSRTEALADRHFDAFVATPGYACDVGPSADVVLESGRIVDAKAREAREKAVEIARQDRPWKEAIVRRLPRVSAPDSDLPSLRDIEANAAAGALTASMRIGWAIAVEAGLMERAGYERAAANQLACIDRELAAADCP